MSVIEHELFVLQSVLYNIETFKIHSDHFDSKFQFWYKILNFSILTNMKLHNLITLKNLKSLSCEISS